MCFVLGWSPEIGALLPLREKERRKERKAGVHLAVILEVEAIAC